jgi:RNA polymerase sigma-70 factor, ECF subfamily
VIRIGFPSYQPEAFLDEWDRHKNQLYARIVRMTCDRDVADDLLQEVFLRAYAKRERLALGDLGRYCMTVAKNTTLDYLIRQQRLEYREVDQVCERTPHDLYVAGERQGRSDRLWEGIGTLPARQQQAIHAYLTYDNRRAAAKDLGIPASTLRARQHAAVAQLRRYARKLR